MFFDNNCQLLQHILSIGETRLRGMGFPVDVFHALTKHKDSDVFCQMNCNPAGYPELHDDNKDWVFNSSAAEQTNVWYGQFLPMVWEMTAVHFNFVLDEMLIEKNEHTVAVLARRGRHPRLVPVDELKLPRV